MVRAFTQIPTRPPEPYDQLELARGVETRGGRVVPEGSRGIVVETFGGYEAFMVEFHEPFAALVIVDIASINCVRG